MANNDAVCVVLCAALELPCYLDQHFSCCAHGITFSVSLPAIVVVYCRAVVSCASPHSFPLC
jgi:hypothetical protein